MNAIITNYGAHVLYFYPDIVHRDIYFRQQQHAQEQNNRPMGIVWFTPYGAISSKEHMTYEEACKKTKEIKKKFDEKYKKN